MRPLVQLALAEDKVELVPGSKATLTLRIERSGDRETPIQLSTSRLPAGVTIGPLNVLPAVETLELEITAGETAKPSLIPRVVQLKATTDVAGQQLELPTQRFVLKVIKK